MSNVSQHIFNNIMSDIYPEMPQFDNQVYLFPCGVDPLIFHPLNTSETLWEEDYSFFHISHGL